MQVLGQREVGKMGFGAEGRKEDSARSERSENSSCSKSSEGELTTQKYASVANRLPRTPVF